MKTDKQFAAWVDGIRWQFDLYIDEHGQQPGSAGEVLGWIHKAWRDFKADRGELYMLTVDRYCSGHRYEQEFKEWLESRIFLKCWMQRTTP